MNFFAFFILVGGSRVAIELINLVALLILSVLCVITCSLILGLWKFLKALLDSGIVLRVTTRTLETFG
jgi:hypothetical protein